MHELTKKIKESYPIDEIDMDIVIKKYLLDLRHRLYHELRITSWKQLTDILKLHE